MTELLLTNSTNLMAILGAAAVNNATAGAVSAAKSAAQGTMDIISNYNPLAMTTGALNMAKQQLDKVTVCLQFLYV